MVKPRLFKPKLNCQMDRGHNKTTAFEMNMNFSRLPVDCKRPYRIVMKARILKIEGKSGIMYSVPEQRQSH